MQGRRNFKIGIVAGEVSGDLLAAGLIRELKQTPYTFEFTGIAGPNMQLQGCRSLHAMEKLTLMGLDGIFARIWEILHIRRSLVRHFLSDPPDLFIGVDAPDFAGPANFFVRRKDPQWLGQAEWAAIPKLGSSRWHALSGTRWR